MLASQSRPDQSRLLAYCIYQADIELLCTRRIHDATASPSSLPLSSLPDSSPSSLRYVLGRRDRPDRSDLGERTYNQDWSSCECAIATNLETLSTCSPVHKLYTTSSCAGQRMIVARGQASTSLAVVAGYLRIEQNAASASTVYDSLFSRVTRLRKRCGTLCIPHPGLEAGQRTAGTHCRHNPQGRRPGRRA